GYPASQSAAPRGLSLSCSFLCAPGSPFGVSRARRRTKRRPLSSVRSSCWTASRQKSPSPGPAGSIRRRRASGPGSSFTMLPARRDTASPSVRPFSSGGIRALLLLAPFEKLRVAGSHQTSEQSPRPRLGARAKQRGAGHGWQGLFEDRQRAIPELRSECPFLGLQRFLPGLLRLEARPEVFEEDFVRVAGEVISARLGEFVKFLLGLLLLTGRSRQNESIAQCSVERVDRIDLGPGKLMQFRTSGTEGLRNLAGERHDARLVPFGLAVAAGKCGGDHGQGFPRPVDIGEFRQGGADPIAGEKQFRQPAIIEIAAAQCKALVFNPLYWCPGIAERTVQMLGVDACRL